MTTRSVVACDGEVIGWSIPTDEVIAPLHCGLFPAALATQSSYRMENSYLIDVTIDHAALSLSKLYELVRHNPRRTTLH